MLAVQVRRTVGSQGTWPYLVRQLFFVKGEMTKFGRKDWMSIDVGSLTIVEALRVHRTEKGDRSVDLGHGIWSRNQVRVPRLMLVVQTRTGIAGV